MRTTRRGGPLVALFAVLLLVAGVLAGCSSSGDASLLGAGGAVTRTEAQQVLDQRAAAIRNGDLPGFLKTLDTDDKELVRRQRRYFASLRQLPVQKFSYLVLNSDWPPGLRLPIWG